jgi:molecular chaperone HtpG
MIVNSDHTLIQKILEKTNTKLGKEVAELRKEKNKLSDERSALQKSTEGKKEEELVQADKDKLEALKKQIDSIENQRIEKLKKFGKSDKLVKQLIDLALLANNMLKGEDLAKFVRRSVELIK